AQEQGDGGRIHDCSHVSVLLSWWHAVFGRRRARQDELASAITSFHSPRCNWSVVTGSSLVNGITSLTARTSRSLRRCRAAGVAPSGPRALPAGPAELRATTYAPSDDPSRRRYDTGDRQRGGCAAASGGGSRAFA